MGAAERRLELSTLQDPKTIRTRCSNVLRAGLRGDLEFFSVDMGRLEGIADRVEKVTLAAYPKLDIPRHSRFNHFKAGGLDRLAILNDRLPVDGLKRARSLMDLVVVSVLLDAGAGPQWRYRSADDTTEYSRSEGLAVASFDAFMGGLFSSHPNDPLRVDAEALERVSPVELKRAFQVSASNPMNGLEGRCGLLQRLGKRARSANAYFGETARIGGLVDGIKEQAVGGEVSARKLLPFLLEALGPIWPSRNQANGLELGDVWRHPQAGGDGASAGWLPLHKLSQWLCYSVLEVLGVAGLKVVDEQALTGLAEYRNGGLLLDGGLLVLRDSTMLQRQHSPSSGLIIEWRALTVALLDRLLDSLISRFDERGCVLTLGMVLEGGSWQAGRQIASQLRQGADSPLVVQSDGTLF